MTHDMDSQLGFIGERARAEVTFVRSDLEVSEHVNFETSAVSKAESTDLTVHQVLSGVSLTHVVFQVSRQTELPRTGLTSELPLRVNSHVCL